MEEIKNLQEQTTAANIADTDQNLSVESMYHQSAVQSLAYAVCSVSQLEGPTGGIFNIRKKDGTNDFELVRTDVQVFPFTPVNTGITQEVLQDIEAQYGLDGIQMVVKTLKGIANESENVKLFEVLDANSKADTNLQLSDSLNAEVNLFEITQRVHEIVLKMNQKNFRTYEAFCILPATPLGGLFGLKEYSGAEDKTERGLFVTQIGQTKFYLNPNINSNTAYVGLRDSSNGGKSSLVFSPYKNEIYKAQDPASGEQAYFLTDRFAITPSPLNVLDNEMLYKFEVLV